MNVVFNCVVFDRYGSEVSSFDFKSSAEFGHALLHVCPLSSYTYSLFGLCDIRFDNLYELLAYLAGVFSQLEE